MSTIVIELDGQLDDAGLGELQKALVFFFGPLKARRADADIVLESERELPARELQDVVRHFLRGHQPLQPTVIAQSEPQAPCACDELDDDRVELRPGSFLCGPEWLADMRATQQLIHPRFERDFGAPMLRPPALVSRDMLIRAGYYKKFPQHVNAVSRLRENYWDGVTVSQLRASQTEALSSYYVPSDAVLNPVTCLTVYATAPELIERYQTDLFMLEGPVFRHESHNYGANRMAEFTVFEMVKLGGEEEVRREFARLLDYFEHLFRDLRVPFRIETSADPFFGAEPSLSRRAQEMSGSKYEILVDLGDGEMSVGSVNFHGRVFAQSFALGDLGIDYTCCGGFGMERLAHVLRVHGRLWEHAAT